MLLRHLAAQKSVPGCASQLTELSSTKGQWNCLLDYLYWHAYFYTSFQIQIIANFLNTLNQILHTYKNDAAELIFKALWWKNIWYLCSFGFLKNRYLLVLCVSYVLKKRDWGGKGKPGSQNQHLTCCSSTGKIFCSWNCTLAVLSKQV